MTKQLLIRDTPHDLKQALMAAAQEQDSNVQAVAVGFLAEEFGIEAPVGRGQANAADVDNPTLTLRMPAEIHKRLRIAAAEEGMAHADMALLIMGKHLGIEIQQDRLNRRRGRGIAAA